MSKFLASLPIAFLVLCLVSCNSSSGKTLSVTLGNSSRVAVVGTAFTDGAAVNYHGSRQLGFVWTVQSQPAGGGNVQISPVAGTTTAGAVPVSLLFGTPGTYVIGIQVYEVGGNITSSTQATYVVKSSSG